MLKKIKVGVFDDGNRQNAYTRDYNREWKGCCEHEALAENGKEAKKLAIKEHRLSCIVLDR